MDTMGQELLKGVMKKVLVYEPASEIPYFLTCPGATDLVFFPQTIFVVSSCNSDALSDFSSVLSFLKNDFVGVSGAMFAHLLRLSSKHHSPQLPFWVFPVWQMLSQPF